MNESKKFTPHPCTMWCKECDNQWNVKDYFKVTKCEKCKAEGNSLYRTTSSAFVYAYINAHKKK